MQNRPGTSIPGTFYLRILYFKFEQIFYSRRRILQPFKAGDECDTFCERSEQYGKIKE